MPVTKNFDELKEKIHFCYSLPVEMTASLHVLTSPTHHTTTESWANKTKSLISKELKLELDYFSKNYYQWLFIMDIMTELKISGNEGIKGTLNQVKQMPIFDFAYHFLGLYTTQDKIALKKWLANPDAIKPHDLGLTAKYLRIENVRYFLHNTEEVRSRLIKTLNLYWNEVFHKDWPVLKNYLKKTVEKQHLILTRKKPIDYVLDLHDHIILEDNHIFLNPNSDFKVNINEIEKINIYPSFFTKPYLMLNIVNNKVTLYLNVDYRMVLLNSSISRVMISKLKALANETRLNIIKTLWNGNATTQELSEILNLAPSTISIHLKELKDANLVKKTKIQKFVYYELIRESLDSFLNDIESMIRE